MSTETYDSWFFILVIIAAALKLYEVRIKASNQQQSTLSTSNEEQIEVEKPLTNDDNEIGTQSPSMILEKFKKFQTTYVFIFLMAMLADWMQGPYVYKLYASYELSQSDIAALFVVGFGCSGVFGTFIGGLTDKFGRRLTCLAFCICYAICCFTKHFHNYSILLIGRVLGGISTSILFSAFESWMVTHHNNEKFPSNRLGDTFSLAWSLNSVIAVIAGVITSYAVSFYKNNNIVNGPPISPYEVAAFDCSAFVLILLFFLMSYLWSENYGNSDINVSVMNSISNACNILINDKKILFTGMIQTGFESAMYIFVFMWTPALESCHQWGDIDHGMIFADFMISCLIGTLIASLLSIQYHWKSEQISLLSCLIACVFILIVPNTESYQLRLFSFFMFEVCVGMYFPTIGNLRSKYIPDAVRATVMNIFRVPFNMIVVIILLYVSNLGLYTTFVICTCLLLFSVVSTILLNNVRSLSQNESHSKGNGH